MKYGIKPLVLLSDYFYRIFERCARSRRVGPLVIQPLIKTQLEQRYSIGTSESSLGPGHRGRTQFMLFHTSICISTTRNMKRYGCFLRFLSVELRIFPNIWRAGRRLILYFSFQAIYNISSLQLKPDLSE